jgi:hypothetical protein
LFRVSGKLLENLSDEQLGSLAEMNDDLMHKWYRTSISLTKNMDELNARWQQLSSEEPAPMTETYYSRAIAFCRNTQELAAIWRRLEAEGLTGNEAIQNEIMTRLTKIHNLHYRSFSQRITATSDSVNPI